MHKLWSKTGDRTTPKKPEPIPVLDYHQHRKLRRLVHKRCRYDGGNCIALGEGEECVCIQSISYSLL